MKKNPHQPFVLAVGGTGGHLLPALALKGRLKAPVWLIGKGLKSHVLTRDIPECIEIGSATFSKKRHKAPFKLLMGFFQSLWHLQRLQPRAVIGFGSYHSLPVCIAARCFGIPLYLYEYNVRAGRANRWLSRLATSSGVVFEVTAKELKSRVHVVEPLLMHEKKAPREEAAEYFGLDPNKKTLLIFGGSQGAIFLNSVAMRIRSFEKKWQVVHLAGANVAEVQRAGWSVRGFEKRMDLAWSLADLALCRAGAGTICEARAYGVPAVFVPYPHARGHQKANGELMERLGLGLCIEERAGEEAIAAKVIELMDDAEMSGRFEKEPIANAARFEEVVL